MKDTDETFAQKKLKGDVYRNAEFFFQVLILTSPQR